MHLTAEKIGCLRKEKAVQFGLSKGNTNYQKLIIFSNYRCGSNFLMNLIKSHAAAVCYSEVFFSDRTFWASTIYGGKVFDDKLVIA
jgi:hypothetical protein